MKFFIAIALLAALASAEYTVKNREDLIKYRKECVASGNVSADLLEKYKKWDFPDDATTHCYLKCVLEKYGLFDEEKGFNVENVHNQMVGGNHADHTDNTHAKIEICAKEATGANACERCYRGAMCFIRENLHILQKGFHGEHDQHEHEHKHEHEHEHEHEHDTHHH